ncbi:MAG: hypothetical protein EPO32_11245 [Anaerolineae bacterium]|nr:MAG: hypothetical protein EPO32_11245 [Anaerolineae bacterium]
MSFFEVVRDYFERQPLVQEWGQMAETVRLVAGGGPQVWKLPLHAAAALGGGLEVALPAIGAVGCAQISITLIDDMLDEDAHGLHQRLGMPASANLAAGFQALGAHMLAESPAGAHADVQAAYANLHGRTAYGQHLDVQNPADEAGYWTMVACKSATFYGEAFYLGARLAGATPDTAAGLRRLWGMYGEIIQIHDDMKDSLATPAEPDWLLRRLPLPVLFASVVEHPQRARFEDLRQQPEDPAALEEAQRILLSCGAISYCLNEVTERWRAARALLAKLVLPEPTGLENMLDGTVQPVAELLKIAGVPEVQAAAVVAV